MKWIQMYFTTSSKGNPMYTNAQSVATKFGRLFQGSKQGEVASAPWCLVIKDINPDKCPKTIWANTDTGEVATNDEYKKIEAELSAE